MKTRFSQWTVVTMVVMLMLLTACSGGSEKPAAESPKVTENKGAEATETPKVEVKKDPVELRFTVINDGEAKNVEPIVEAFHKKYPYVTVKVETLPDYNAAVITKAASGDLGDVFQVLDTQLQNFVANKILYPLDDYLSANQFKFDDIYPAMLRLSQVDGKTYILPRDYNHIVIYVNTTLLKNEGIPMPGNDWKWDDFVNILKQTTKKDSSGQFIQGGPIVDPFFEAQWTGIVRGHNGSLVDEENKKVTLSDPKVLQSLKEYFDLFKEGYMFDAWSKELPKVDWTEGKSAFMIAVRPGIMSIEEWAATAGFEWDVLPFPELPERRAVGSGMSGYGVFAKSKHTEEAAALVSFITSEEGQKQFETSGNSIPVLKSMANSQVWRDLPVPGKNMDAFVIYPEADVVSELITELPLEVASIVRSKLREGFNKYIDNSSSLEDAMKAVDEQANAKWKELSK
ncbi:ABC transporter substrate-binding protein [Paenibacillus eucommiae]|uniref:Multiple sugar transport system substrate-binding protein n=1 Tax=Paenibacillus eucommiae TaxID=1355755 RepID=A0ABS4IMU0_9BACL|nr:sugar ABC transporter substrate-binding protein [Paenibacillus eucommiae]MBP1988480.1 multiple sugar transport system substrate-binding protein [Paenibacillus eucommiae]